MQLWRDAHWCGTSTKVHRHAVAVVRAFCGHIVGYKGLAYSIALTSQKWVLWCAVTQTLERRDLTAAARGTCPSQRDARAVLVLSLCALLPRASRPSPLGTTHDDGEERGRKGRRSPIPSLPTLEPTSQKPTSPKSTRSSAAIHNRPALGRIHRTRRTLAAGCVVRARRCRRLTGVSVIGATYFSSFFRFGAVALLFRLWRPAMKNARRRRAWQAKGWSVITHAQARPQARYDATTQCYIVLCIWRGQNRKVQIVQCGGTRCQSACLPVWAAAPTPLQLLLPVLPLLTTDSWPDTAGGISDGTRNITSTLQRWLASLCSYSV